MDSDQVGWGWKLIGLVLTPLRPLLPFWNWVRGYGWHS
jgi:hypothetical protein